MKIYSYFPHLLLCFLMAGCSNHEPPAPFAFDDHCNKQLDPYCGIEKFQQLSIENKLKAASAVILTKNKIEGSEVKEYVDQVLKLQPGTTLYLRPGTLFKTHQVLPNTNYGDGSIAILRGSPATPVESYSYENGTVTGLGYMPLAEIRRVLSTDQARNP